MLEFLEWAAILLMEIVGAWLEKVFGSNER